MTTALLASIPLQLLCHLMVPGVPSVDNTNFAAVNQQQIQSPISLPTGATAVPLADLSLEVVCQLLVTSDPTIAEDGNLVVNEITRKTRSVNSANENDRRTISPTQTPQVSRLEGYVIFPEHHTAYKIHNENITWNDARDRCISEGARLAIIDSQKKIDDVTSLNHNWEDRLLHVDVRRISTSNGFIELDNGLPLSHLAYKEGYHNIQGNCTGITGLPYELYTYSCTSAEGRYVCEFLMGT